MWIGVVRRGLAGRTRACSRQPTTGKNAMLIGEEIRKLREAKGLSQEEIEQRAGLLKCYVSRVENGHTVPSLETLERFAAALEVPLYQLFYAGSESPPLPDLTKRQIVEYLASDDEDDAEKRFKRIRRFLARERQGSEDAKLAFSTLAKLFAKL